MSTRPEWGEQTPKLDWADRLGRRLQWLESPLSTYYLLLASAGMLTVIGLIMVLSASSVNAYVSTGSAFTDFINQTLYAVLGLGIAYVVSRVKPSFLRRIAPLAVAGAVLLQSLVLVPGIRYKVNGNTNWIHIGSFTMQPAETGKIALTLICALVLDRRKERLGSFREAVLPVLIYLFLIIMFVMAGGDLGTTMVLGSMGIGMLFVAGVRRVWFAVLGLMIAILLPIAVLLSGNRTHRIGSWLHGCHSVLQEGCYQPMQGRFALADGGLWGVGPGGSREKWQWLPEAKSDFIFSILGEELGLPGTLLVIALYIVFAYACYRLIARSRDMFVRVATSGVMIWICVQAMINIGSVVGLLPIVGVPLPLVSAGGTALIMTLFGIGMVISFARQEPEARLALAQKPRNVRRSMAVLPRRKGN